MKINGTALLQQAVEAASAGGGDVLDMGEDLDMLARRSGVVIDSLNLTPELLGKRESEFDAALPAGASEITWGPGGGISTIPPTMVSRWGILLASGYVDFEGFILPGGTLADRELWQDRAIGISVGRPYMARWARELDADGRDKVLFYPTAQVDYTIRLWGTIPAVESIEQGIVYDLPQGLARFFRAELAIDICRARGQPVRPELFAEASTAADRLEGVESRHRPRVSPRWLVGDFYDHLRAGVGLPGGEY